MRKKIEIRGLRKQPGVDELENLFEQFDQQFAECKEKVSQIKACLDEYEAKTRPVEEAAEGSGSASEGAEVKPDTPQNL